MAEGLEGARQAMVAKGDEEAVTYLTTYAERFNEVVTEIRARLADDDAASLLEYFDGLAGRAEEVLVEFNTNA